MGFVCPLDNGEYALIEMQVMPADYFDNRALAYAALLYGNQLEKGDNWSQIKRIIGVNILGGGFGNQIHWVDTPKEYVRHYKFQDQVNKDNPHFITGIEIIQYELNNVPEKLKSQEEQNWFSFLKNAHNMKEEDVKKEIKTPEVLHAFDLMKLNKMPAKVLKGYQQDKAQYERFSEYIAGQIARAEAETKKAQEETKKIQAKIKKAQAEAKKIKEQEIQKSYEMARILYTKGMSLSDIRDITGLSLKELRSIQNG